LFYIFPLFSCYSKLRELDLWEPEDMEASTSNLSSCLTQVWGLRAWLYACGWGLAPTPAPIWGPSIDDDTKAMRENRELRNSDKFTDPTCRGTKDTRTSFKESKCYWLRKEVLLFHVLILDNSLYEYWFLWMFHCNL